MARVLVFGGHGFLGDFLCTELRSRGHKVYIADIDDNGNGNDHFYTCDILDRERIQEVLDAQDYDVIYNLAGFSSLEDSSNHPIKTFDLNVMGNLRIIDHCSRKKIKRFVYASSAYATSNKGSFYGISKLASEKIIEEYGRLHQLPYTILRYGSVYSEKGYYNNYLYNLVKNAMETGEIVHQGDGMEIREYIHAADAAKLSVDILDSEAFKDQHVILTGTERMRRKELFEMIREILNDQVDIKLLKKGYKNHYRYTPYSFQATASKKLVANPHIDMGQGILEIVRSVYTMNADT